MTHKINIKMQSVQSNASKPTKRCRVCGDVAQSFNFQGVSCESCKTFFRRNAFCKNLACFNNERCEVTVQSRRFCKHCRLQKCFRIGMKSELIKKRPDTESSSSSPASSAEQPPSEFRSLEPYESTCLRSVSSIASVFNEKPLNRINVTGNAIDLQQVFSMQSFFVESLIKVADSLEGFTTLKWHDKLTVLHQAFPKIMILRSAFFFNFEENSFYDRECNNAVMVPLKLFYGPTLDSIIGQHRRLAHLICEVVERDTIIRDFLVVLILFQSRGNISCLEFLSYCYTKYSHLFERYLVYKYQCASKGKEQFEKLMQIIDDVGPLKKMVVEIYDKLDFNIESTSWTVNTVNGEND